jgi:hypothetical protein
VIDRLSRKVDIEVWPVEMISMWPFDVAEGCNRCVSKPRELPEWDEALTVVQEQPEAMPGNVSYLNG